MAKTPVYERFGIFRDTRNAEECVQSRHALNSSTCQRRKYIMSAVQGEAYVHSAPEAFEEMPKRPCDTKAHQPNPMAPRLDPTVLFVQDTSGKEMSVSVHDLSALHLREFSVTNGDRAEVLNGFVIRELLGKIAHPIVLQADSAASSYLLAEGRQGKKVVISWAELDSQFTDKDVYIVPQHVDSRVSTISALRLVIPFDKNRSRWLNDVTLLRVQKCD